MRREDKDRLDTKKRLQKRQIDLAITWNRLDLARELLDHIQIGVIHVPAPFPVHINHTFFLFLPPQIIADFVNLRK